MSKAAVKVLLVGESGIRFSSAAEYLAGHGCECQLVSGCLDGARLVSRTSFDVILCSGRTRGFQSLVSAVLHSSASLFRYLSVEDGCWWVSTVSRGELSSHGAAFRDAEFAELLDSIITDLGVKSTLPHTYGMRATG